jgi:hypothetical protein
VRASLVTGLWPFDRPERAAADRTMAEKRPTARGNPSPDHAPSAAPPRRVRSRLDSPTAIMRELGHLYRLARGGGIAVGDASKLGNLLYVMSRVHADALLDARIAALERAQRGDA